MLEPFITQKHVQNKGFYQVDGFSNHLDEGSPNIRAELPGASLTALCSFFLLDVYIFFTMFSTAEIHACSGSFTRQKP